jgi:hypothetical protein
VTSGSGGKGFGSNGLKVNGKMFAFLSSKGAFVVKLPRERAGKLIAARHAVAFDAGRGREMKEWIAVRSPAVRWASLAKEARDFVGKVRTATRTKQALETAHLWTDPAPMDAGTRLPVIVTEEGKAWVAYRAQNPDSPGGPGEPFGVLRFDDVTELVIGSPSDHRLPVLYGRGLELHSFHRVHPLGRGQRRWIVTFYDRTLYVRAAKGRAFPLRFAATAEDAITSAQSLGTRASAS